MQISYGQQYENLYRTHWWWRAREAYVLRWVRRLAGDRRLGILDIGCGDGLLWKELERLGDVEGIEPDERLVDPTSEYRDRIEVAPFPSGRKRDRTYDLVLMLDVLEHIEDDHAAMLAVSDLLSDGGHVVLTVPALMSLWSEFDVINGHFRRYRRRSLRDVLTGAGFEVVSCRYYYFWPVAPLIARRLFFKSSESEESKFLSVPPTPVNRTLEVVSKLEHRVTSVVPMPFGSSLIAVVRKP